MLRALADAVLNLRAHQVALTAFYGQVPWFANLTRLYSRKRWVTMRYTPAQLGADPGRRTLRLILR